MDLIVNCSKNSKWHWNFSIGNAVFKLRIKTIKMLSGSTTREPLGLPKFGCYFFFLGQFTIRCIYIIFQESIDYFEIEHKTCLF